MLETLHPAVRTWFGKRFPDGPTPPQAGGWAEIAGGRILLLPDVVSYYFARRSLADLVRMYYQYGYYKPLVARKVDGVMTLRQLVPGLFVLTLASTAALAPVLPLLPVTIGVAGAYLAARLVARQACGVALSAQRHADRAAGVAGRQGGGVR